MRRGPRDAARRGVALIMVLVLVGVTAMLVASFALLLRLETQASANSVDTERARLAAWSGVERAKFELRRVLTTPRVPPLWVRCDPDDDGRVPGDVDPGQPLVRPLTDSRHPSFRLHLDPVPQVLKDPGDGRLGPPHPSGVIGGTHYSDPENSAFRGDYYTLRVVDNNACLHLNDGNPALPRMLDGLAEALEIEQPNLGQTLVAERPREGYRSVEEVRGLFEDPEMYARAAPYLTCHAWVDRSVLAVPADSELSLQPRAPVNLNAAPWPVLVAVFRGIQAGPDVEVDVEAAKTLAHAVIRERQPALDPSSMAAPLPRPDAGYFRDWAAFYAFLQRQPLDPLQAAAVMANCNPNADINRLVPDVSYARPLDKTDLTQGTTELCLTPGGIFTIESLGVVLGPPPGGERDHRPLAEVLVRSVVRVFERAVDTSQRDFETGRVDPVCEVPDLANLRDMTTLPEYRNQGAEDPALLAADYDGQVTANVIAKPVVSRDGFAFGFIGGTLAGQMPESPYVAHPVDELPAEPPRYDGAGTSVAFVNGSVDFEQAGDLYPLGLRLGPRALALRQGDVIHTEARFAPGLRFGDSLVLETWPYDPIDALGLELWFKPEVPRAVLDSAGAPEVTPGDERQYLLWWESGDPREPAAPYGVFDPVDDRSVTWGARARLEVHLEPDDQEHADRHYALVARFRVGLGARDDGEEAQKAEVSHLYDREWRSDPLRAGTWHHVQFSFWALAPRVLVPETRLPDQHVSLFLDGEPLTGAFAGGGDEEECECPGECADPHAAPLPQTETGWPTEIHAQARLAERRRKEMAEYFPDLDQDLGLRGDAFQVNVQVPSNDDGLLFVGQDERGERRFRGLIDNLVINGGHPAQPIADPPEFGLRPRFLEWRPSLGRLLNADDDPRLYFAKRAPALEWDRPVRLGAARWTAWHAPDPTSGEQTTVRLRVGWGSPEDGAASLPPEVPGATPSPPGPAADAGWTLPASADSLNGLGGGAPVPRDADSGAGDEPAAWGRALRPGQRAYYAIELTPASQTGSAPPMAPVIDDVVLFYFPSQAGHVIHELEVVDP